MLTLTQQAIGSRCRITWMLGLPEIFEQLQKYYHIDIGSELRVITKDKGWMMIGVGDYRLAIDSEITDHIRVCAA